METIYNVDYFIKKFQAIPDRGWFVGGYYNPLDPSQKCAAGWCGGNNHGEESKEAYGFYLIICKLNDNSTIADINDGKNPNYQQPTPKQRILAALYDIYEKTYGRKYGEEPKEKVIYKTVVIDSKVKELQETLTVN